MSIDEAFAFAMKTGDKLTAYALFQGMKNQVLKGSDPYDEHSFDNLDFEEVAKLKESNVLKINMADLYSVQIEKGQFAMFFAYSEGEVRKMYRQTFAADAGKVRLLDYAVDKSMYTPSTNKHETWTEIRESMKTLPAFAGVFVK